MVEGLAILTGVELGKWVLDQVLDLGKPVLESYVQDFFRDSLDSGVARLNTATLKTPMAEAIGFFMQRFIKELQFNDIPDTSINHHYNGAVKKFVQNKAVRPILGKAFETGCKKISYDQLQQIWIEQYQEPGWQFPAEDFDWPGVAKAYVVQVKAIIKADATLRAILDSDLLEDIARNTAQLSPGFDTETYRASLQASYGYLKLYTLDSTDRADTIKLWNIFIEQTVREALPPTRYDLPLDLKRQLQAEGRLNDDLSAEALEYYRRDYFQQPARKVLETIADSPRAVVLGDPGAGKSSLLQYLALEWVEGNTDTLPLLIELREFALADSASFLDFLHRGRGVDWQFDQQQLHQHLLEAPTLVMFDGLDEIFDRATQSAVIDDIIRFAQQYPQARVLVTSRIVGYNHERLQHSGFRHFTIQSLDTDEIHEFIDRWYDLSMGSDPDRERLKQRLNDAVTNSKAIQNLADNPLLLTMMAILNKDEKEGLPQNKVDLYQKASELLLHKWDFEAKHDLKDPRWHKYPIEIDHRKKRAMLQKVAYFMQGSREGLEGNLISRQDLENCLKLYLKTALETDNSPSIAKLLVDQLHKRDSVLCHYGANTYGFVHRTFLEYLCAVEIVHCFEKQYLTLEQIRDDVFGQHWQDEVWHEVLRLLCNMLSENASENLIAKLIEWSFDPDLNCFAYETDDFSGIFLASECLSEVRNRKAISETDTRVLQILQGLTEYLAPVPISEFAMGNANRANAISKVRTQAVKSVAKAWQDSPEVYLWMKNLAQLGCSGDEGEVQAEAVHELAKGWKDKSEVLEILKTLTSKVWRDWYGNEIRDVQSAAIQELAEGWADNPDVLSLIWEFSRSSEHRFSQTTALRELIKIQRDKSKAWTLVKELIQSDQVYHLHVAIQESAKKWKNDSEVLFFLRQYIESIHDAYLRSITKDTLMQELLKSWAKSDEVFNFLCSCSSDDLFVIPLGSYKKRLPRFIAIQSIVMHYSNHPEVLTLLQARAVNDHDEQLRQWAQEQLEKLEIQNSDLE